MSFFRIFAHGNLTRDPTVKVIPPNATNVAEFGIACNRKFKTAAGEQREEVSFLDCVSFGKVAEIIGEHFRKGKAIIISGRLKQESWTAQDGTKRSKHVAVVEDFDFVGPKDPGGDRFEDSREPEHRPTPQNRRAPARGEYRSAGGGKLQQEPAEAPFTGEHEFDEKDIPFVWSGRSSRAL